MRNKCNKIILKEKRESISNKILQDPIKGLWKQYNSIVNGKSSRDFKLKEGNEIITDENRLCNIMNEFFRNKVLDIKNSLPKSNCDPLGKLKEHIDNKSLSFRIQTISIKEGKIALKNMNPKMSSGVSEIPKKNCMGCP